MVFTGGLLNCKVRWRRAGVSRSMQSRMAVVAAASESVVNGVAHGRLTPAEGHAFSAMLEGRRHIIETQEQDQRIRALEDRYPEESTRGCPCKARYKHF